VLLAAGLVAGCGGSGQAHSGLRIYDPDGRINAQVTSGDVYRSSVQTSSESGGTAVVYIALTPVGDKRFRRLTGSLAHQGARLHREQHFAFEVDGHVYARPSVDYHAFPDGYSGRAGIDIHGIPGAAAKGIAARLREEAVR
jgi:hypothetical protein